MASITYSVPGRGEPSEHHSRPPAQQTTPCRFVRTGQPTSTGPRLTSQKRKGADHLEDGRVSLYSQHIQYPCPLVRVSCKCIPPHEFPFWRQDDRKTRLLRELPPAGRIIEAKGAMASDAGATRIFDRCGRPRDYHLNFTTQQGGGYIRDRWVGKSHHCHLASRMIHLSNSPNVPSFHHGNPMRMPSPKSKGMSGDEPDSIGHFICSGLYHPLLGESCGDAHGNSKSVPSSV